MFALDSSDQNEKSFKNYRNGPIALVIVGYDAILHDCIGTIDNVCAL